MPRFRRVLSGLDTVQVSYFLRPEIGGAFSFESLMVAKERARANKAREGTAVEIGGWTLVVRPHGSTSGYPLVLAHPDVGIECGEFNNPTFYVTYRSEALWSRGAKALHEAFMAWAGSLGMHVVRAESLSRVDFTFDYVAEAPDFSADAVVSHSAKDSQYREDGRLQTLSFGKGDIVLRIYDKVAEIAQQSDKAWFFDLWGVKENVWRIEWQVRKDVLRRFSIRTFDDLFAGQGDVLRYLANEHDSLRVPAADSNRSRWPIHPLWQDLLGHIGEFKAQGVGREIDPDAALRAQLQRIAVQVYGYYKRVAAIRSLQDPTNTATLGEARSKRRREAALTGARYLSL